MKEITLSQGKVAQVDDDMFEYLNQWKWTAYKNPKDKTWYALRATGGRKNHKTIYMHREIMNPQAGMEVDHKDGNGLNNQKGNLRICTKSQNQYNKSIQKNNKSGYKGVWFDKIRLRWAVSITIDGKSRRIGRYTDIVQAARAYDEAAKRYYGEFAKLNFP